MTRSFLIRFFSAALSALLVAVALHFPCAAGAQSLDSLPARVRLLTELVQAGNFETAQVEAENFRSELQRTRKLCPPAAVSLISAVYSANKDEESARHFLTEVEVDARRDTNPDSKAALLQTLLMELDRWGLTEQALSTQRLLVIALDSIEARHQRAALLLVQARLDSLQRVRELEQSGLGDNVVLPRNQALQIAGFLLLAFVALLFFLLQTRSRLRKQLAKKELELDIVRTNLRSAAPELPVPLALPAEQSDWSGTTYNDSNLDQVALVIEPNRRIVLYLRSLLSYRFDIQTAMNANEGLQQANQLVPDLIICNAQLNGKSGIELIRQLKLAERTNHIPIILLTPRHGNEGKLDALRAGADGWFTRPLLETEFYSQIDTLFEQRNSLHEEFDRYLHLYFTDNKPAISNPFLTQTMRLIEVNLGNADFTAEELARQLQFHKNHLTKKLRWLTGKEPNQLLRELRLEKAKVLLEKKAGSPQSISEMVGFSNPGTFALAFKEYFGENTLLLQGRN